MGMFKTLLDDFKAMIADPGTPTPEPEDWDDASDLPAEYKPERTISFAHDEADIGTPHMVKVTIDRAGNTILDTGTMTYEEVAAAASEFRRIANKLAQAASQMKKWTYKEGKKGYGRVT